MVCRSGSFPDTKKVQSCPTPSHDSPHDWPGSAREEDGLHSPELSRERIVGIGTTVLYRIVLPRTSIEREEKLNLLSRWRHSRGALSWLPRLGVEGPGTSRSGGDPGNRRDQRFNEDVIWNRRSGTPLDRGRNNGRVGRAERSPRSQPAAIRKTARENFHEKSHTGKLLIISQTSSLQQNETKYSRKCSLRQEESNLLIWSDRAPLSGHSST